MHRSMVIPVMLMIVGIMSTAAPAATTSNANATQVKQLKERLKEIEAHLKAGDKHVKALSDKLSSARSELDSAKAAASKTLDALTKSRLDYRTALLAVDAARVEQGRQRDTLKSEGQKKPEYVNAVQACSDAQDQLTNACDAVREKLAATHPEYSSARNLLNEAGGGDRSNQESAKTLMEELEFAAFKTDPQVVAARKAHRTAQDALAKAETALSDAIAKDEKYVTLTAAVAAAQTQADQCRTTVDADEQTNLAAGTAQSKAQAIYDSVIKHGRSVSKTIKQLNAEKSEINRDIARYTAAK